MTTKNRTEVYTRKGLEAQLRDEMMYLDRHDSDDIAYALACLLAPGSEVRVSVDGEGDEERITIAVQQKGVTACEKATIASPSWSAGWNIPGYLPDYYPATFLDHEDARKYISAAIREDAENAETEEVRQEMELAAEHVEHDVDGAEVGYGRTVGRYHYWITKV